MLRISRNVAIVIFVCMAAFAWATAMLEVTYAQANAAAGANATCMAKCAADDIKANSKNPPQPQLKCVGHGGAQPESCQYSGPGGSVQGMCLVGDVCEATSASKQGGGSGSPDAGLSQLSQILGQLMSKLMQGGGGGGSGSGSGSGSAPGTTGAGCTTYSPTSDPTQVGVNPCVYYVPSAASQITPTTGTGSSASDLLNALNGSNGTGTIIDNTNTNTNTNGTTTLSPQGILQLVVGSSTGGISLAGQGNIFSNGSGILGNIVFLQSGGTIFGQTISQANNSEVSGFYGSDTIGSQPRGVVAGMCVQRPWTSNFLSNVIPPTFFDSLCQWGGFPVGTPPKPAPQVTLQQTTVQAPAHPQQSTTTAPVATSTKPTVAPQVQIWAVPSSVPLGSRTEIFWNTQGVTNCTETSPDGSFSNTSLSGAGATVPITKATTFTISCIDANGHPVTDYVTVQIAI